MTVERRAVRLVFRRSLIEEFARNDHSGWEGFYLIKDQATDIAISCGWPDWVTVAGRLEWRHLNDDAAFYGHMIATFEVMDA